MSNNIRIEVHDRKVWDLIPENGTIERIASGFVFTEGPVWCGDHLLFSDIPMDRILRLRFPEEGSELSVFLSPSGNSNGLTLDRRKRLIICEHSGRRVSRLEEDGTVKAVAERYRGKRLNSPNDVVVRSDGSIYFTDPPYGLTFFDRQELPFNGVYRITPDGELILLVDDFDGPNGLVFSPDESVLYVNDTARGHIRAFDVAPDGALSNGRLFLDMQGVEPGVPDGMKVNQLGYVFCTGPGGFWIISPEGQCLARVMPPELPANFAWGDSDGKTLYLTARTGVYRMRVLVPGNPVS